MVGVQSLSIGLSIALVVCTGVIVGTLSITSGQDATDNARATGDRGVASALESSDKDIKLVAARYLARVTASVDDNVGEIFSSAATILETGAKIGRSVHPDIMLMRTPEGVQFVDTVIRQFLSQSLRSTWMKGFGMMMYRFGDGGVGSGEQVHFLFDPSQVVWKTTGELPWGVVQSQPSPVGGEFGAAGGPFLGSGESGPDGRLLNPTDDCWFTKVPPNVTRPDLNVMGYGNCVLPRQWFYNAPTLIQSEKWMLHNAKYPDTPEFSDFEYSLAPADQVIYTPMFPYFAWMNIQAHIAFTHPDMDDMIGPRQGKRVGYFSVSIEGGAISRVFEQMPVPEGSILYCVDRNPWTGDVGQLIATNYLRLTDFTTFIPPGADREYVMRVPIHVTNHTLNASTDELSEIGEHGRHVFARGGGTSAYEQVANATTGSFIEWTDSKGTTFWYTTLHTKFANLNWYINLLVPRSTVMDSIDASVLAIRAANAADKADADKKQEESLTITIVVTVVVAAVLMAASVLMTKMILAPIVKLGDDMASVATMKVESVDLDGELSSLSEVHRMQESFRTMVRNLIEYKQYMPQSVLIDDDDEDEDESDMERQQSSVPSGPPDGDKRSTAMTDRQTEHRSKVTSHTTHTTQSRREAAAAQASKLTDTSLKRKPVSIVVYNIRKWSDVVADLSDRKFQELATGVYSALLASVVAQKGIFDMFAGDRFMVAHNAFSAQATHKAKAIKAALDACHAVSSIRTATGVLELSYGVSCGEAKVGQMGCTGMKKVTIHSTAVPFAVALERHNKENNWGGVVEQSLAKDLISQYLLKQVDSVECDKALGRSRKAHGPVNVYEVCGELEAEEDEWMYQIEQAETAGPYAQWNSAFALMTQGDWEALAQAMKSVPEEQMATEEGRRMERCLSSLEYRPTALVA